MTIKKQLGIWMDNATAHVIEFSAQPATVTNIDATFTHQVKQETLSKSEHVMHNKEQANQVEYYKKLGAAILNFEEVLLFGPTNAKAELFNVLKADHHFDKIKIEMKQADKMTEHQQHDFVKEHFTK